MRETKFRFWDKVQKCWLDYEDIFIDQEGEIYLIEERTWSYQSYMHKENVTEKVEKIQYTGLKDKNGKEIYEGDIFKNNYSGSIFEAFFSEKAACYRAKRLKDGWQFNLCDIASREQWEVIGNMFESRN